MASEPTSPPPVTDPAPPPPSAIRSVRAHVRLWLLALLGLAADLWSKAWAFDHLKPGEVRPFISGLLEFRLSLNPGALFGLGSGLVPVFIVASIAALGFVVYLFAGTRRNQWILHAALALILAGALGNLYDRTFERRDMLRLANEDGRGPITVLGDIEGDRSAPVISFRPWLHSVRRIDRKDLVEPPRRVGVVRDFLKFQLKVGERDVWPWVFNLADVFLVIGVGVLLISYCVRAPHVAVRAPDSVASQPS
jgi:signal peptidase II